MYTPHTYELLKIKQDKELEEFLRSEICCQNFINQDLTFLQPSVVHTPQPKENKTLPEKNITEIFPIEIPENNPPQEQDIDLQQSSAAEAIYNQNLSTYAVAPIQLVEPVVGLTPEEQWKKEEDPNLTLGLISCEGHINTPSKP